MFGFTQPVGLPNSVATAPGVTLPVTTTVWNTIKGGSTVPLKFNLFTAPSGIERTSLTDVTGFTLAKVACTVASEDAADFVTTGGTSLRYDATEGHFIQNWQSPKGASSCYRVTMTAKDGSSISAFFKTK